MDYDADDLDGHANDYPRYEPLDERFWTRRRIVYAIIIIITLIGFLTFILYASFGSIIERHRLPLRQPVPLQPVGPQDRV